jgi:hypothetical protein
MEEYEQENDAKGNYQMIELGVVNKKTGIETRGTFRVWVCQHFRTGEVHKGADVFDRPVCN